MKEEILTVLDKHDESQYIKMLAMFPHLLACTSKEQSGGNIWLWDPSFDTFWNAQWYLLLKEHGQIVLSPLSNTDTSLASANASFVVFLLSQTN